MPCCLSKSSTENASLTIKTAKNCKQLLKLPGFSKNTLQCLVVDWNCDKTGDKLVSLKFAF